VRDAKVLALAGLFRSTGYAHLTAGEKRGKRSLRLISLNDCWFAQKLSADRNIGTAEFNVETVF
jgi:hypothetical protein